MPDNNHDLATLPRTFLQARFDQKRSDAPSLKCWKHRHRCKCKRGNCAPFRLNLDRAKEDVPYGSVVGTRDDADWGEYSDIDMKFLPRGGGYVRKNGDPIE